MTFGRPARPAGANPPLALPALSSRSGWIRRSLSLTALLIVCLSRAIPGFAGSDSSPPRPAKVDVWDPAVPNALTETEREEGWRLLFDGVSGAGWRAANRDAFPEDGWTVSGGVLSIREAGLLEFRAGGDLFSRERFGDFVLDFAFQVTRGGNSGIKYRAEVQRQLGYVHGLGCEFQILDDAGHTDADRGRPGTRRLAGLYDLLAPAEAPFHGLGTWNHGRIHLENGRLSHYLNGIRVVDVQMDSPEWRSALAGSKFADREGFCAAPRGHIVLQDHGDLTRFRNVRIRSLDSPGGDS